MHEDVHIKIREMLKIMEVNGKGDDSDGRSEPYYFSPDQTES